MTYKPNPNERHEYSSVLVWTGAQRGPTSTYQAYSREYEIRSGNKAPSRLSADPHYRGDGSLYNPEEQLLMALSGCHMLSYLAECALAGVHVVAYEDEAHGTMTVQDGKLGFTDVLLHPRVTVAKGTDLDKARALHEDAHAGCYIANSVNFPVRNEATVIVAG